MAGFSLILVFTLTVGSLQTACGGVIGSHDGEIIKTVTGHLYFLDSATGEPVRLRRRHVETPGTYQNIRLSLGSEGNDIDMKLTQRSVWTKDSRVVVRDGDYTEEVPVAIDAQCFLTGSLTSEDGVASFDYCNGLSGVIHTRDVDYEIETLTSIEDESEAFAELKVKMMTPSNDYRALDMDDVSADDDDDENDDPEDEEHQQNVDDETVYWKNATDVDSDDEEQEDVTMEKRKRASGIAAEVGVWLDQNILNYHKSQGKRTDSAITSFMITKWNLIAQIYGNKADVGVDFDIQLKYLELWWNNPSYYRGVQNNQQMSAHLRTFCSNTRREPYDHRMLYTYGVGGAMMGLAYVGQVCQATGACSVVKSKLPGVRVEIHEFGHNIGFPHEPRIRGCTGRESFMGWTYSYDFKPCYRDLLLQNIRKSSYKCLYQQTVNKSTLNKG